MAREIPKAQTVHTTKYANFKGVDFTNDPTNVWYRRSPSAVNMLPDASGRPFKRHGWSILLSQEDLCTALSVATGNTVPSCEVNKCSYFELAGVDHIVVFTDYGVIFYNGDENETTYTTAGITDICTDSACYTGYDRSFFFEGDGTSAFYIYGNFKVWRYESDFLLHDVTNIITVPTILIGTSADCVGTTYEGYNLLGTQVAIEYCDTDLFAYWGTDGLEFSVDKSTFTTNHAKNSSVLCEYDGSNWKVNGTTITMPYHGITVYSTPKNGDKIYAINANGVLLPNNVSPSQVGDVTVRASKTVQYDYPLDAVSVTPSANGEWLLHNDPITTNRNKQQAWIEFYSGESFTQLVAGEDYIRVVFPSGNVTTTQITNEVSTGQASLIGA